MQERDQIKIYPLVIGTHSGKPELRSVTTIVREGRVVVWNECTVQCAWEAVLDSRDRVGFSKEEVGRYTNALCKALLEKDVGEMRKVTRKSAHLIPQAEELLELPDEMLLATAKNITEAFSPNGIESGLSLVVFDKIRKSPRLTSIT